uniref:Sushi domain-containing protein n=1 Tax=Monopterus albus TaxID=43700 RepID=A0A3Q3JAD1_MONAL
MTWAPCSASSCSIIMTTEKMHERYLRFVFLIWFPGVLHAQGESCPAPVLDNGYFVLVKENDGKAKLTYACDNGHKPAVEGWWATATCQNGKWSHTPRCIDENDCNPPTIPNAKYTEDANGWYKNGNTIRITCDKGYASKDWRATARCISGSWSSLPICESKSVRCCVDNCGPHPNIPNGDVVQRDLMFLKYQCNANYTLAGPDTVVCYIDGTWSQLPTCTDTSCVFDTALYAGYYIHPSGVEYMKDGERKLFSCIWQNAYIYVQCINKSLSFNQCKYTLHVALHLVLPLCL